MNESYLIHQIATFRYFYLSDFWDLLNLKFCGEETINGVQNKNLESFTNWSFEMSFTEEKLENQTIQDYSIYSPYKNLYLYCFREYLPYGILKKNYIIFNFTKLDGGIYTYKMQVELVEPTTKTFSIAISSLISFSLIFVIAASIVSVKKKSCET